LLEALKLDEYANKSIKVLDLGCGYGVIGLTIAKLLPKSLVYMVDTDFTAVEYAKKNAQINNIKNVDIFLSNGFNEIHDNDFDLVVSNLPAKTGKELLHIFLYDALKSLNSKGRMTVVTITGLREFIKRNFKEYFGNYEKISEKGGYTVSSATKS